MLRSNINNNSKTSISHPGQCSSVTRSIINVRKEKKTNKKTKHLALFLQPHVIIAGAVRSSLSESSAKTIAQRLSLYHTVCIPGPGQYDEHEVHTT